MILGNRKALDAERRKLLDAFDAVWCEPCEAFTVRQLRALSCATKLAECDGPGGRGGWIIGKGWRLTTPEVMVAQ